MTEKVRFGETEHFAYLSKKVFVAQFFFFLHLYVNNTFQYLSRAELDHALDYHFDHIAQLMHVLETSYSFKVKFTVCWISFNCGISKTFVEKLWWCAFYPLQ